MSEIVVFIAALNCNQCNNRYCSYDL